MRGGGQWDLAAKSLQRTRRPIRGGPAQWLGWVLSPPTPQPRMCPPSTLAGRGGESWGSGPVLPVGRGLSASLLPSIRSEMKGPHGHPSGGVGGVEQRPLPGQASPGSPTDLHRVRETPKVPTCRVTVPPAPPQSRAGGHAPSPAGSAGAGRAVGSQRSGHWTSCMSESAQKSTNLMTATHTGHWMFWLGEGKEGVGSGGDPKRKRMSPCLKGQMVTLD